MADAQASYQALLSKISALGAKQHEQFGEEIRCREGCYACCHPPDSLFRVEAKALLRVVAALPSEAQTLIEDQVRAYDAGERLLCPLLDEAAGGRCMAYEGRPSICRTQGYGLWLRHSDEEVEETGEDGALSWCELNFLETTPNRLEAFDVERLNVMLSLITQLEWPQEDPRVGLVPLLQAALATDQTPAEATTP